MWQCVLFISPQYISLSRSKSTRNRPHYCTKGAHGLNTTSFLFSVSLTRLIISSPAPSPTPVPPRFPSPAPAHFPSPSRQRVERRNEVDTEYESRHDNQLQIYESEKEERHSHYHSNPTHAMGRSSSSSSSSTVHGNKRQSEVRYSTGSDGAAKPRRDIGNLLVKHTTDEEGRPVKLRGVAADPLIYRLLRRICHADGGDSENDAGMRLGMGMGRSGAVSCGIKVDGTVVRRRQSMIQPLPYRVFPTGRASVKKSSTSLPSSSSSKSY